MMMLKASTTATKPTGNLNSVSSSSISSSSTFSSSSPTRNTLAAAAAAAATTGAHHASSVDLNATHADLNGSGGRTGRDDIHISSSWVPPNDRELIFRAKLKTGWSSRSTNLASQHISNSSTPNDTKMKFNMNNSRQQQQQQQSQSQPGGPQHSANHLITDAEFIEIERVMQRASMIEQKESDRVNKLYTRYNTMNRPMGNGETSCYICNYQFGILSGSPRICTDCLKHVCITCSIDALSSTKQTTIWLCKICSEYRDLLKKTGAWFNKRLPKAVAGESSSLSPSLSIISNSSSIGKMKQSSDNLSQPDLKSKSNSMINEPTINDLNNNSINDNEDGLKISGGANNNKENKDPKQQQQQQQQQFDDDFVKEKKVQLYSKNSELSSPCRGGNKADELNRSFNDTASENIKVVSSSDRHQALALNDLSIVAKSATDNSPCKNVHSQIDASFSLDNKHLVDQIAASKNLTNTSNLNSTAIVNSTAISAIQSGNKDNHNNSKKDNFLLTKTSTLNSESSNSNLSLAFQKYNPAGGATATSAQQAAVASALTAGKTAPNLGYVQFSVEYIPTLLQLKINLISASNLPACDSNGFSDPYVKLHLLPGIAKATKLRSKTIYKNLNPVFNETFHYDGVTVHDIENKTLRLTVLDEDKFGFDFIGEYRLPLKTLIRNEINHFNVPLEEKQELGDEADTTFRGKINFALKYSRKNNCLHVKVNRCTQLLPMDNGKSSDPFVEISLSPSSKENKQKFRTAVKWKTLDPEYLEEFKFTNIDLKTLLTKTIELTVWDKDFGSKNDFIGVVQLGQQRTGEELKHFFTMIKNPDLFHEQWHTLHLRENEDSTDTI